METAIESSHIIFIHGLANKPSKKELKRIWLEALATPHNGKMGFNLGAVGVHASFVYWADLFYDVPLPSGDYESIYESRAAQVISSLGENIELDEKWSQKLFELYDAVIDAEETDPPLDDSVDPYEWIPLPDPIKKEVMKRFVREAHSYLFNINGIRDTIRQRVLDILSAKPFDNTVIVGHSQGSFIAYDVLTSISNCPEIQGLMTLGSPLGIDEIQQELTWTRNNGFPSKLKGDWINIYDSYDLISMLDPKLANDFQKNSKKAIIDINEQNWGKWRHSATKYFKGPKLRENLRRLAKRS